MMVPVQNLAKELEISPQQVRNLIKSGEIGGEKVGNIWLVDPSSIERVKKRIVIKREDRKYTDAVPIFTAISYFSGAMGLDLGLNQAGIKPILACENDKTCRDTIIENNPKIGLIGDIENYTPENVLEMSKIKPGKLDLIIGGPPCQAFSSAGKRQGFEDARGNVFLTYIKHIISLKPKYAVIENVRGLLSAPLNHVPHNLRAKDWQPSELEEKGGALKYIIRSLEHAGYGVSFNLYNSANFGSPQKRERLIIICCRDGSKAPFLQPTHSENGAYNLPKWKTLREAFIGLDSIEHHYIPFPEKRLKYYRMLKAGENWRALPVDIQKEALGKSYYAGGGKTGFLRRLSWDTPSPTLVTHPAMPATDLAHPVENRPLSIKEYKRIQEFPDNWIIKGGKLEQYRQIGNAVPISLGKAVGKLIMSLYKGKNYSKNNLDFPFSRYKNTCHETWSRLAT